MIVFALIWSAGVLAKEVKLMADDGERGDEFGTSVSISGNYAIVGAGADDDDNENSGSAYVFKRDGASWKQQAKLVADKGRKDDWFGSTVVISDDFAFVAAPWSDSRGEDTGTAYIFKRNDLGRLPHRGFSSRGLGQRRCLYIPLRWFLLGGTDQVHHR